MHSRSVVANGFLSPSHIGLSTYNHTDKKALGSLKETPSGSKAGIQAEGLPQAVLDHIDGLSNQDHTSESSHPLKQEEALKERR